MKTFLHYITLLLITLKSSIYLLYGQEYHYSNYTHKDGLQNVSITTLTENSDGGIIIGTEGSGIIEFDGYEFKSLIQQNINNNHQVSAVEINKNAIYFASRYRGIYKIDAQKSLHEIVSSNSVKNFISLALFNNELLYINNNELYRYDIDKKTQSKIYSFKKDISIYQTIKTPNGLIYLTTIGNFIYSNKSKKIVDLNTYFNTTDEGIKNVNFGYYANGLLYFFNFKDNISLLVLLNEDGIYNSKIKLLTGSNFDSEVISATYNKVKKCFTAITKLGRIYEISNGNVEKKIQNTSLQNIAAKTIISDYYGDYWIGSYFTGLIRVSKQPFTKIEYLPNYLSERIGLIDFTQDNKNIIYSTMDHETFVGNYLNGPLKKYDFQSYSSTYFKNTLLIGTNNGVYEYIEQTNELKKLPILPEGPINHIVVHNTDLYIAVRKKGLYKFDKNYHLIQHFEPTHSAPSIIYTSQIDGDIIYFGTSQGIKKLDTKNNLFSSIDTKGLGEYCGLSITDVFGTKWFALDFGLLGISKKGEKYVINDPEILSSFLFYSLNTDSFGNLYIGTNNGINVLKVNDEGKVLSHQIYTAKNGFGGYEPHMRSSFQTPNFAFIGTLEGIWKINFNLLQGLTPPQTPIINIKESIDPNNPSTISIQFISKNPKIKSVYYTYRIVNNNSQWSALSLENEFNLSDLKNGDYSIEVKATYDGVYFSDIGVKSFHINQTVLQSKILIYLLISFIVIVNILFFLKAKKNDPYEVLSTSETIAFSKHAPSIILLGLIMHIVLRIILPLLSTKYEMDPIISIPMAIFLAIFTVLSRWYKRNNNTKRLADVLKWAYCTFMLYGIFNFYISEAHILYAFFIVLVNSIAHIIFDKTKYIILYTSVFLITMTLAILYTKNIEFDRFTLMIPIVISSILTIFLHVVKQSSIQQLSFISSIINKSNIIALALNKDGNLKYISNNISNYIDCSTEALIDQPISKLNDFIVSDSARQINITKDFVDGKDVLTPMKNINNDITWIEWSCKEFAKGVRVLIGQDVTEKLKIQNTYEILVENAEDLIFQINMNGDFKFLNERFNNYLPYNKNSLINKNIKTLIPNDYHLIVDDFFNSFNENDNRVSYIELPIYNSDNQLEWFGLYLTKLYSEETNELVEYLVVGRNITEKLKQDKLIATQQANITSSINYAQKIQLNLLPAVDKMKGCFSEQMVYYKPKDIVSGDFYWCKQVDDYIIVAVGDGTGHGVPGAFMSILGINLLNSIVLEKNIYDPGRILDELDIRLKQMLQEGKKQRIRDGIEITICAFNPINGTIDYSCAGSKILIHDGVSISIRKGDSKHVGDEQPDFTNYITHHYEIAKETTIYMFTDGYYDQFGGFLQKKYTIRRLLDLFTQNISLPLSEQREIVDTEFIDWKGENEQTDDITIVGLRILPPKNN